MLARILSMIFLVIFSSYFISSSVTVVVVVGGGGGGGGGISSQTSCLLSQTIFEFFNHYIVTPFKLIKLTKNKKEKEVIIMFN